MLAAFGSVFAVLAGVLRLTGYLLVAPASPGALGVTVLAVTVLAAAVAVCLASGATLDRISAGLPLVSRAAALREKSWSAAFLRLQDPDAAGRPRPRAPSAAPAAACP
jgi:hypothetical protein